MKNLWETGDCRTEDDFAQSLMNWYINNLVSLLLASYPTRNDSLQVPSSNSKSKKMLFIVDTL